MKKKKKKSIFLALGNVFYKTVSTHKTHYNKNRKEKESIRWHIIIDLKKKIKLN